MTVDYRFSGGEEWVVLDLKKPQTYQAYALDPDALIYARDKHETAHMDYDSASQTRTFIYNILDKGDSGLYQSRPMTFIHQPGRLMVVKMAETTDILRQLEDRLVAQADPLSWQVFLFSAFEEISHRYYPILDQLEESKDEINARLRQKTTKKDLFALSDISLNLLYISTSSRHNSLLLERIKDSSLYKTLNEQACEQFADALIEARQLHEMADLSLKVLESLSENYNNILNNNLNANLSVLNIIDILLAVMAVVTGFFGMNVPLPFTNDQTAWIGIVVISLGVWMILAQILKRLVRR